MLEFAQREGESHGRPSSSSTPRRSRHTGCPTRHQAPGRTGGEDGMPSRARCTCCNKLYCEQLGHYYANHYKQLAADPQARRVDFRCVRFSGLISAPRCRRAAPPTSPRDDTRRAKGEPYTCFVRPDARIPVLAMPDGVAALLRLAAAPAESLTRSAYNVTAFNPSAREIRRRRRPANFPSARPRGRPTWKRQGIIDSGRRTSTSPRPAATGDSRPHTISSGAFGGYLIPRIRERYATS